MALISRRDLPARRKPIACALRRENSGLKFMFE